MKKVIKDKSIKWMDLRETWCSIYWGTCDKKQRKHQQWDVTSLNRSQGKGGKPKKALKLRQWESRFDQWSVTGSKIESVLFIYLFIFISYLIDSIDRSKKKIIIVFYYNLLAINNNLKIKNASLLLKIHSSYLCILILWSWILEVDLVSIYS